MHISKLLLALAVNASLGSACTFEFDTRRNFNTADRSGGLSCEIRIFKSDDADLWNDKPDHGDKISCSKGCKTIKYNDAEYEICHGGPGKEAVSLKDATIQRKGGGTKVNIIPDGEDKGGRDQSPFHSTLYHSYWRRNIRC